MAVEWIRPGSRPEQVQELLADMRKLDPQACCRLVGERLGKGDFRAQTVWDAVHLMAGELMMRQPGIYGIHTVTSANALHYAFRSAAFPVTRLLLALQAVGWMVQFPEFMATARGGLKAADIFKPPGQPDRDSGKGTVVAKWRRSWLGWGLIRWGLFGSSSTGPASGCGKTSGLARVVCGGSPAVDCPQGHRAHHYKYGMAIFENLDGQPGPTAARDGDRPVLHSRFRRCRCGRCDPGPGGTGGQVIPPRSPGHSIAIDIVVAGRYVKSRRRDPLSCSDWHEADDYRPDS
ncbi:MAG: hypothetical protein Ct9H300mP1_31100 [Planctomycetaceae bacterium]|nr:MAG: hypothetical protein Ct9H300mP1_31100 [Planctomycetaceae bacterium]